ncbi:MAG: hypothetical protein ABIH21_02490 [Patescibacteria group bacterium]
MSSPGNEAIISWLKQVGLDFLLNARKDRGELGAEVFVVLAQMAASKRDLAELHELMPRRCQLSPEQLRMLKDFWELMFPHGRPGYKRNRDNTSARSALEHWCDGLSLQTVHLAMLRENRPRSQTPFYRTKGAFDGFRTFEFRTDDRRQLEVDGDYVSIQARTLINSCPFSIVLGGTDPFDVLRICLQTRGEGWLDWKRVREIRKWFDKFPQVWTQEDHPQDHELWGHATAFVEIPVEDLQIPFLQCFSLGKADPPIYGLAPADILYLPYGDFLEELKGVLTSVGVPITGCVWVDENDLHARRRPAALERI